MVEMIVHVSGKVKMIVHAPRKLECSFISMTMNEMLVHVNGIVEILVQVHDTG